MSESNSDFYSLSSAQFEEFVAGLLTAEGYLVTRPAQGVRQKSVDLEARKDRSLVAVEVKHTRRISLDWVGLRFASMVRTSQMSPDDWWLVTSAQVDGNMRAAIIAAAGVKKLRVIDGAELRQWSQKQASAEAVKRITELQAHRSRQWLIAALITFLASWGLYQNLYPKKAPLDVGIQNVTSALQSLNDLEQQLIALKSDMAETERARVAIMLEYSKAKELEKLTDEQMAAVKNAVKHQTWREWLADYLSAFLLGVASSIIATLLWEKFTRWRSQRSE